MTDEELKSLVVENTLAIGELRAWRQESERRWQELRQGIHASREESERLFTSFNCQLGQLGSRFGDEIEYLFRPFLAHALRERFGMGWVTAPLRRRRYDEHIEIDMVGQAEDTTKGIYLVEIKSRLRQAGVDQILDDLRLFPRFFPEHRGVKLFGILAALDIPSNLRQQVLRHGLYLATICDDIFEIVSPDDFSPRAFGIREA